ncbi:putative phage-type endonuclease [Allocoprococcus comes]|uniref:Putative phage-type endonuclease n=1 Tax=Coprococcus comes TaxID=410072 RepID=A0A173TVE8_9FIRM|nr:YqaJ viral recombinase family protein [Coprococcus comes]CUN06057.1 putative phage-type endonuclease [Coprococcus comes]
MEPYKIYDFEDEKAWLKGRLNGIGGSDASAVVGKNPYKTNIELFEEKTGRRIAPDISEKPYVIYGKEAEQYIRELFRLDYPQYQVMHHEYRKKFPGLGEYYHSGRESGRQKSPSEYARDLVEFMDELHEQYENRIFYIFLDPSAKGLAEEVKRATRTGLDYQVLLRDAENDVALGISRVQKALVFDIMSISPKQEYAVQEFGTYEYDKKSIEKGKEVPVKEADHCMDAIRYVVMGAWSKIKHWLPKDETPEEIDICDISSREVREEDEYL